MFTFALADLDATGRLASTLAGLCTAGDVIALYGTLGAGKTSFARLFAQALGIDEEVPSPTFTLVQTYPLPGHAADAIWHFDMYRINQPEEAWELDIEDAFETGISLIEWPEKLGNLLPDDCLTIRLEMGDNEDQRLASIDAPGNWAPRLAPLADQLADLMT